MLVLFEARISVTSLFGKMPTGYSWWTIILLAIAGIVFSIGAMPVVWYPLANAEPDLVSDLLSDPSTGSRLNIFILIVIMAPLIEESLFRGLLFSRLTAK